MPIAALNAMPQTQGDFSRLESRLDAVVDAVGKIRTSPAIGRVNITEASNAQTLAEMIASSQAARIIEGTV